MARDDQGNPYTVRYEAVNAMLLNEFLKEHRKVEEQSKINQRQEATIARLEATLKSQAAQIQKVSDQLNSRTSAPVWWRIIDDGFIVNDTQPKKTIVRAIGPSVSFSS